MSTRTINLNHGDFPRVTVPINAFNADITGVVVETLSNGFGLTLEKPGKPGLLACVTNLQSEFGKPAKNIWNVKNISQDYPIDIQITDDKLNPLLRQNLKAKVGIIFTLLGSVLSMLACNKIPLEIQRYGKIGFSNSRYNSIAVMTLLLAFALASIPVMKMFDKIRRDANFEIANRVTSIYVFAEKQTKETKVADFDDVLILSKP